MNKDQFLSQLRRNLASLPEAERQEILYDYEEHFRMGLADGKSEEAIAQSLGNPRVIGNAYRIDAMLDEPREGGRVTTVAVLRAVFASISLTFLNLIFVLGPFAGLVGVLAGLWAAAVAVLAAGLGMLLYPICPETISIADLPVTATNSAFVFFSGLGTGALGLLACIGMMVLSRWFFRSVAAYIKFNARIVTGAIR